MFSKEPLEKPGMFFALFKRMPILEALTHGSQGYRLKIPGLWKVERACKNYAYSLSKRIMKLGSVLFIRFSFLF